MRGVEKGRVGGEEGRRGGTRALRSVERRELRSVERREVRNVERRVVSTPGGNAAERRSREMESADFKRWVHRLKRDAASQGISRDTIEESLRGLTPLEPVVAQDANKPEIKLSAEQYISRYAWGTPVRDVRTGAPQVGAQRYLEVYWSPGIPILRWSKQAFPLGCPLALVVCTPCSITTRVLVLLLPVPADW